MSDLFRTNISLKQSVFDKAKELMELRDFGDFSGFVAQLIREEHERRNGPATLQDKRPTHTPPAPGPSTSEPYKTTSAKKKRLRSGQLRDGRQS